MSLSPTEYQIILGGILGDGNLRINGRYPQYREGHSIAQEAYLLWKAEKLKALIPNIRYATSNKGHRAIYLRLKTCKDLRPLYNAFYLSGTKKAIDNAKILLKVRALALAVWFMDDGTVRTDKIIRLNTQGFNREGHEALKTMFAVKWGWDPRITLDRGKYYHLVFRRKDSLSFYSVIESHIHPTMAYKGAKL